MPGRFFLTATIDELAGHFGADAAGIEETGPRMDTAPVRSCRLQDSEVAAEG